MIDDDAVRSLVLSTGLLGTREIMIIDHAGCGVLGFTGGELEAGLREETARAPVAPARCCGLTGAGASTEERIRKAGSRPWIPAGVPG